LEYAKQKLVNCGIGEVGIGEPKMVELGNAIWELEKVKLANLELTSLELTNQELANKE